MQGIISLPDKVEAIKYIAVTTTESSPIESMNYYKVM